MRVFDKAKLYVAAVLGLAVIIIWGLVFASRPVSQSSETVQVTIARGQSARQAAETLKKAGVIRSTAAFRFRCKVTGLGGKLKPGTYAISKSMNVQQIVSLLASGETIRDWLTIPEGFTIRQIADQLQAKGITNGDRFVQYALSDTEARSQYPFIYGSSLEGYLFPDTYLFPRNTPPQAVIQAMLSAFESKIVEKYAKEIVRVGRKRFNLKEHDFNESLYRILIMASLVEREAKLPKDRPKIAAVLWNRLEKHIRLEVCATVSYVPGVSRGNKEKVYIADTKADTPYNTYRINGLPPTPICNPGEAAIEAVLRPANVDYLYYVARSDGGHIFSRTYSEHLAAKKQVSEN